MEASDSCDWWQPRPNDRPGQLSTVRRADIKSIWRGPDRRYRIQASQEGRMYRVRLVARGGQSRPYPDVRRLELSRRSEQSWLYLDDWRVVRLAEGWTGPAGSGCPRKGGVHAWRRWTWRPAVLVTTLVTMVMSLFSILASTSRKRWAAARSSALRASLARTSLCSSSNRLALMASESRR